MKKTLTKEKEAPPVLDLRMDRPGHWGLPVRYRAPPRFLAASLIVGFVGLATAGPSIFSAEALGGLYRQVMTIARAVHLAEQLRESPPAPQATQNDVRSHDVRSPDWVLQSDGSYKLRPTQPAPVVPTTLPEQPVLPQRFAPYTGPDPNRQLQLEVDAAEMIVDVAMRNPSLVDSATAISAQRFLASMPKCVPGRSSFFVPPGRGPGFAN